MKIITKSVIKIETDEILYQESYQYYGKLSLCIGDGGSGGGGSAGGGGGSSGKIDYPDYLETIHADWLDDATADAIDSSMVDAMNAALGSSPWAGEASYDPNTPLANAWTAVCAYNTVVDALSNSTDWTSAMSNARTEVDDNLINEEYVGDAISLATMDTDNMISDEYIETDSDAFAAQLDDQIDNVILSKFRGGYRDVNAVQSSSFTLGEAIIEGFRDRDVAKHESAMREVLHRQRNELIVNTTGLRVKHRMHRNDMIVTSADNMIKSLLARVEFERSVAALSVEAKRIHIVAKKEELKEQWSVNENDAQWDLEVFQYGANLLAAIAGGTVVPSSGQKQPSTAVSAIGGALSGAAMGASVGGAPGAVIGGMIGMGAALLQ